MNRLFARWSALAFATAALAVSTTALPPSVQAQALNCINTPGTGGGFTLVCTPSLNCTIGASPSTNVAPGSSITLTATCTPAASGNATYVWSLLSGDPSCSKSFVSGAVQSLTSTAVTSPACNYQVAITDGAKGGSPSLTVSWTNTPPPAPTGCVLSLTTTPSPLTTAAFNATPSVANCSPTSGLIYSWTKNGTAWAGANTANPTDNEAANTGTGALNYTYTPTICNGPSQGTNCVTLSGVTASQPGSGGGGGGGQYNCHALNPSVISGNTTSINLSWTPPGTNITASMGVHDAIVVSFTTGSASSTSYTRIAGGDWNSADSTRFAVLSTRPCDFGSGVGGPYAVSNNSSVSMYFNVGGASPYGFPVLQPNTQYFLNVMNAPNPTCANNGSCGMFFSLYKGAGL